jgi:serine/threonine protein kinase
MASLKFISKGAYGCVFTPPLPCEGDSSSKKKPASSRRKKLISKLYTSMQDYHEEVRAYEVIEKIDPGHKWSLPLVDNCIAKMNVQAMDSEIMKCPKIESPKTTTSGSKYGQIILPNGGQTLRGYFSDGHVPLDRFLEIMEVILTALCDLNRHGYAHLDVKPDNILINANSKVYLIDYSLITHQDRLYDIKENKGLFAAKYVWYPPEFYIYYKFKTSPELWKSPQAEDLEYLTTRALYIFNDGTHGIRKASTFYKSQHGMFKNFVGEVAETIREGAPVDSVFHGMRTKADIYSTGIVFLNLFEKHRYRVNNRLYMPVLNLLHSMVNMNPFSRVSAEDALAKLVSIKSVYDVKTIKIKS